MKYRVVSVLKDNRPRFLIISDIEEIEILPSKYLKHLDQINASPNTVKSAAFALSYYYNYLQEQTIGLDEITLLSYSEQNKHFIDFLYWVKSGKHTEHNTQTSNKTCNMYLGAVFRYYQFLALEDVLPMLKVLRVKKVSYFDSMGVNHQNAVNSFKGFFKEEEPNLEEITSEEIQELINACTNDRDRLLIAMMAETGLRLGEILGIHYTEDIDFERRTVRVRYRESNTNLARAKNRRGNRAMSVKTEAEWDVKTDWNTEGEGTTILSLEKESFYPMLRDMETGIVSIIKSCPFYIGSAEGVNQLKISDKTVSREHAVILEAFYENGGEGYILRDLDSTNGTWIDGRKIKKGSQERLQEGATVRFAQKEYRFLLEHTTIQ